jgi:hypothetical protein
MARFFDGDERYVGGDALSPATEETGFTPIVTSEAIPLLAGSSDFTNTVTPDALTANVNNYSLADGIYFRLSTNGVARVITGLANVKPGRLVFLCNVAGGANITLNNQDAGSDASNRIITGTGAAVNIQPDRAAILFYDGVSTRWRVVGLT